MSFDALTPLLALGSPPSQPGTQPDPKAQMLQMVAMLAFFFVLLWLTMIRPQQKKAKEQAAMLKNLKPGDKVLTSSGILGIVVSIKDKSVSIRSADTKLEILKSAVAEITERASSSSES